MKLNPLPLLLLLLPALALAEDSATLAPRLQGISVTVHTDRGSGSGTIVTRGGINWVLTAGHVVQDQRSIKSIMDGDKVVKRAKFDPVTIVEEIYVDGRSVGYTSVEADVVAYSSPEYGHDLALLKLRSKVTDKSVEFCPTSLLPVGTELVHVGSLEGQQGSNSFTTGMLAQVGRVLFDHVFDQTSCSAFPGSSGGGIFARADGKYVGMLVRGSGETFNLMVPLRRIREWAKGQNLEFIFDPASKAFDKIKLENGEELDEEDDNPFRSTTERAFPYLIGR